MQKYLKSQNPSYIFLCDFTFYASQSFNQSTAAVVGHKCVFLRVK